MLEWPARRSAHELRNPARIGVGESHGEGRCGDVLEDHAGLLRRRHRHRDTLDGYTSGGPDIYSRLGLVESQAPMLLFVPTTYGETPEVGATCSWSGATLTVRDVDPLALDGTTLLANVVISE